jgi:hypothetical protein
MPPTISGLGAVKPHVKAAAEEIAARFQIYRIGGFATSGHAPNSAHYRGLALDVMTGSNPNVGKGNMVAAWALANAGRLSITQVIWNRRINTLDSRGWRSYSGPSPHTDHVHLTFASKTGDGSAPVDTGTGSTATSDVDELKGCLGQLFGW